MNNAAMNTETRLPLGRQFRVGLLLLAGLWVIGNLLFTDNRPSSPETANETTSTTGTEQTAAAPDSEPAAMAPAATEAPAAPPRPAVSLNPNPTLDAVRAELERRRATTATQTAQAPAPPAADPSVDDAWMYLLERLTR